MASKGQEQIIQVLATKYNLSLQETEKIVYSQFRTVAKTMSSGTLEEIRLPILGRFYVLPERVKRVTERKKEKDAKRKSTDT